MKLYPVSILVSAYGLLVAEVGGVNPGIATLIGNGVTVAVLAWYVIYDTKTRTPNMLAAFTKEQAELRAAFTKEQEDLRSGFTGAIDRLRETFASEQNATRIAFATEQIAVRSQHEKELTELRAMLYETMRSMRTAVHDVKDTANEMLRKQEVAAAKQADKM